ncbi:MAG: ATP-dependent DNA helicase [Bdellovibrionales bacterium]|nr:ATP-dependent DNA helicase [Bdellovibrionales bacterium]
MMKNLQLSITEFAVPSPRSGSIETYSGYGGLPNLGTAIHMEIQAQRMTEYPGYVSEKWVTHNFETAKYRITVSGRMDGFCFGNPCLIEEIKSAYNVDELMAALAAHSEHPYKLQLRTYGFLQWLHSGFEPRLNLHVVNARSRKGQDVEVKLDVDDYQEWLARRLNEIAAEEDTFAALAERRHRLAENFVFPFAEPRTGQRELMRTVEQGLGGKSRLLLQAPTGLGKTAGVLFPVLQESMKRGQKTVYLTAKNSQHEVAEDAVKRLQEAGVKLRSVTIHAKSKMCLKEEPHCNPKHCEFARNHYDKVSAHGLREKLNKKKRLTAKTFRKMAIEHEVCPFELQMEAAAQADVVVCDYNYVFSPRNSIGRLIHNGWGDGGKNLPNLVIDEIHNLPARATEYYSARLSCDEIERLYAACPDSVRTLAYGILEGLRDLISGLNGGGWPGPQRIELHSGQFAPIQGRAQELLARYLESSFELRAQDPVLRLCNLVSEFAQVLETVDEEFFITASPSSGGGQLRLTCCDASKWLRESYDQFGNMVGFSATLKPFEYYSRLLGLAGDVETAEFQSPFPRERRKLLLIPQISTKMRDRAGNYNKIKDTIERVVSVKPGNYFVFFPSFDFMNKVFQMIDLPGFRVLCQAREMRREAVATYLDMLRENVPTVIFAVQGGVFAEGVDYPGEMLIGALIVGPALPTFDFERELLREYYENKHGDGFDYAYTYPAMARVVQSAGRVIRSSQDRGLIVLMDRRFTLESYRKSMPKDWVDAEPMVSSQILGDVRRFWEESES